jgi:hypothetical protein
MPDEHFNILGLDPKRSQHRRGHGALSKDYWQKARALSTSAEHVELSNRADFNDCFINHLDFPEENLW